MRAITVRQPWAWAIIHGGKNVENRSRNIAGPYRGPVAIHAAKTEAREAWDFPVLASAWLHAGDDLEHGIRGAVIGIVDLVDVHPDRIDGLRCGGLDDLYQPHFCSPWAMSGHHHLVLANPRPVVSPIPCRGALGLWTVPDDIEARIREQVAL